MTQSEMWKGIKRQDRIYAAKFIGVIVGGALLALALVLALAHYIDGM